jgi:nicotinate-nucleotide adenylyltransferase
MTRRIGVMGGMFDPVHRGHTEAALAARDVLALDEVRLIPCSTPNHREAAVASAEDRLAMLSLAVRNFPGLIVDSRETQREGISYTVDTLESLRNEFPGAMLVLILGEDAFLTLPGWERWRQIFELAHICVVNRPSSGSGQDNGDSQMSLRELPSALQAEINLRRTTDIQALFRQKSGGIYLLHKEGLDIASQQLRQTLERGEMDSVQEQLDEAVRTYIRDARLYGKPG